MKTYKRKISLASLENFIAFAIENNTRNSCILIAVLIEIIKDQGASPADIMEKVVGHRESSNVEKYIHLLADWGYVRLIETTREERQLSPARKTVWLTDEGARHLALI